MLVADPLVNKTPAHIFAGSVEPNQTVAEVFPIEDFPQLSALESISGVPGDVAFQDNQVAVIWGLNGSPLVVKDPLGTHPILNGTKISVVLETLNRQLKGKPVNADTFAKNQPTFLQQLSQTELGKDPNAVLIDEAKKIGKTTRDGLAVSANFWGEVLGIDPEDFPYLFGVGGLAFAGTGILVAMFYFGFFKGGD